MGMTESSTDPSLRKRVRARVSLIDRNWMLAACTLATGTEMWTGASINVILPDLTGSISASADEASWLVTVYTTAFAISIALSHRLAGLLGNRRYLTWSALLYALSSVGCIASPTLAIFLVFRVLQAFAGGAFLVRSFVFITEDYRRSRRMPPLMIMQCGMYLLGRVAAPALSGYLSDTVGWRTVFVPDMVLMLIAAYLFHQHADREFSSDRDEIKPDILGFVLLIVAVGTLFTVLSRGEVDDWLGSSLIVALTVVTIAAHAAFVAWQLSPANTHPLLELHHLANRGLLAAAVLGTCIGILLGGSLYVLPQYLRRVETHSAFQTGCIVALAGLATTACFVFTPILPGLVHRFGARILVGFALLLQAVSMTLLVVYVTSDTPDRYLWLPLILHGAFIAIVVPALSFGSFVHVRDDHASNGRAVYYFCRQLGATLGVALAVILIDRRTTLHSARLLDAMVHRNTSAVRDSLLPDSATALLLLRKTLRTESLVLTYRDVFFAMGVISVLSMLVLPLLPSARTDSSKNTVSNDADWDAALLPD